MQWSHRPTGCFPGPRPSSTQAQAFSAGHSATGARPGEAGQLRMPAWSHRSRHSTLSLHRTVPGLLLGPPASPLYELLRSTKGEPPPAARPPVQGPDTPTSSLSLLHRSSLPPSSTTRPPRHKCALGGRKSVFRHSTARWRHGWGAVLAGLFIAKLQSARSPALPACLPATGAFQSVSIFIPQSRWDNGKARNSLEDIHVKTTDRSPAPS